MTQAVETTDTPYNFNERAEQFHIFKAKKKAIEDRHKEELKDVNEAIELIKLSLLDHLNKFGLDNVKTPHGTIHKVRRRSAPIEDATAFLEFVRKSDAWEFLDLKCNLTAAADYIDEHGDAPPGVTFKVHTDIGVLAPTKKG
jgi:hypothetical protein